MAHLIKVNGMDDSFSQSCMIVFIVEGFQREVGGFGEGDF